MIPVTNYTLCLMLNFSIIVIVIKIKNLQEILLKTQHDDLVESEKALLDIIEELDVEMRKQFEEKFAQIKKQFDIVFKELFNGFIFELGRSWRS